MKNNITAKIIVAVAVCAACAGCNSNSPTPRGPARVIDVDNPETISRQSASFYVGEVFAVRLRAQTGTGFTWDVSGGASDTGVINLVGRRVETDPKAPPGAPTWEVFELHARKSGQTTVEFVYERPWERNVAAMKRFLLTVDVGY